MDNLTPFERRLITLTVMLVAIVEVLDTTIVNVVLPPMMGAFSANSDEITWVLTSYIVSAAVMMPLTGYLTAKLGQKRLLLLNISGFMFASALCGISQNLQQIVLFRIMQGVFGASLVPLSQVILRQTYHERDYGTAMAIWGIGLMSAPVLGPTIGGFISEHLSWRWVFYINVPVCLTTFVLAILFVKDSEKEKRQTDWLGLVMMCISICSFQIFLDKGSSLDWFESQEICLLLATSLCFGTVFLIRGLNVQHNIINLRLFKEAVFACSTFLVCVFMGAMMGLIALQPLMLENVMNYNPEQTGLIMAPRGLTSAFSMAISATLLKKGAHPKLLIFSGLIIAGIGSMLMVNFTIDTTTTMFALVGALQGFGLGFFFVPLSSVCFQGLKKSETAEAAGLFAFSRTLGSSIGISLFASLYTHEKQVNFSLLGQKIHGSSVDLQAWLKSLNLPLTHQESLHVIYKQLQDLSMMNAFDNTFLASAVLIFLLSPMVWFLKVRRLTELSD